MKVPVKFDLYKESGKWKYGGTTEIDGDIPPWEHNRLITNLEENQNEVILGTISGGEFFLVISMLDDFDYFKNRYRFYQMLFTPSQIKGMFRDDY